MNALRGRSSHLAKLKTCTIFGTVKGGYSISFSTGVESLDEDVDLAGLPSTNNHSMQKQTGSSLNTSKRITNIPKQHETPDCRLAQVNHKEIQLDSKCSGNILSEVRAPDKSDNYDVNWTKFFSVSDPSGGGQISNKSKASSPEHVQPPLSLPHFKRNEDDAFVELDGPNINSENRKLATELEGICCSTKRRQSSAVSGAMLTGESFQKVFYREFHTKRLPARKQFATNRDLRNNLRRFDNSMRPALKFVLGEDEEVGRKKKELVMEQTTNQNQRSKTIRGGEKSICIEYVPRGIGLNDIRKAVSVYGEVVGCFLRTGDNGMLGCHLEFKTIDAKERALSNRWVYVNGKQLSVCRVDLPVTTTVRITNLGQGTAVHDVHSICMSYGNMESLQMREDGVVDVFFSVSEIRNMPKLLEKLNEVTLNDSRWIAQPAPRLSNELAETPEGQKWVGQQLSNQISNMTRHLQLRRIYLEDMEELHDALMHIKECASYVNQEYLKST